MLGHQRGRIAEEEPLMSAPELMLLTSYLMADSAKQDYHCLHRVACQEPAKAKQYLAAAKILLRAGKMFEPVLPYDSKYERLVEDMQEAVDFGTKYGTCGQKYTCSENRKSK
ncbi:hypothetical protein AAG570_008463 [Ranatra chinensis]|uniref:KIF-binding protein n=1 Tax=Ranatra chinensis TaxID=642074 RepID=A0ABD0YQZ9_9HEMI